MNTVRSCRCMQSAEETKCSMCGRKMAELKTVQRSGGEESKENEDEIRIIHRQINMI